MSHTVTIDEIEPIELIQYTDNQFMNKLNEDLEAVRNSPSLRIKQLLESDSNSPINMSSDSDCSIEECLSIDESDCFEHGVLKSDSGKPSLRKLTFREVQSSINKYYDSDDKTNELDLLIVYLHGQKQMYIKASQIMSFKTYLVLIPATFGSITVSILCFFNDVSVYLSIINLFVLFLYFLNILFQWNSSSILYRQWAFQFDKIYHSLHNSTIEPFTKDHQERLLDVLQKTEETLREWTIIPLPYECKRLFPILSNIQLFTFVKRIEIYKKNLIMKFKDIKNEIRYIEWKWGNELGTKERIRFQFLCSIKEKIKREILQYKKTYYEMEGFITKEIHYANGCFVLSQRKYVSDNPVISTYFDSIFAVD